MSIYRLFTSNIVEILCYYTLYISVEDTVLIIDNINYNQIYNGMLYSDIIKVNEHI